MIAVADAVRADTSPAAASLTDEQMAFLVIDLAAKHGLSTDRAQMLVDRFGIVRRRLDGAARDLRDWTS